MRKVVLFTLVGCATLGSSGQGDLNLPTSGVGPFRKLGQTELTGVAPFILDSQSARYREPSVLALDADPSSTHVELFAVATSGDHDVIVHTHADDARSFFGGSGDLAHSPAVALSADQAWEGADLSGPSALRVGTSIFLYYSAAGSVGLARSSDGATFTKVGPPVLVGGTAPSVALLPDGRFRMLYVGGSNIYEAASDDGLAWSPLGPVLGPSAPRTDLQLGEKPPFDTESVGDPCLLPRVTPAGRLQFRVLYTGLAASDGGPPDSAIGFAARYGDTGPLVRNPLPVLSLGKHEGAPALFEWVAESDRSLLFVHMDQKPGGSGSPYPAIGGAVAPVAVTLDPPGSFPDSP
jgi:hypothetical protein